MRSLITLRAIAICGLICAPPVFAQEVVAEGPTAVDTRAMEKMAELFVADPLTADQKARIPAANQVVDQIFPPGTYMKMMDESMRPVMDGVMGQMGSLPLSSILAMAGLSESEVGDVGEGTLAELMEIVDPAYQERQKLVADETVSWITRLMDTIEPSFRRGLSRAYAVRFSEAELHEMSAFFSTPTGSHYAGESMLIMTDPQVMAVMGEMMPAMMEMMPGMMTAIQERSAELPPARRFEELSDDEKARFAELLGLPVEEVGE